jgi:hypothetical protein
VDESGEGFGELVVTSGETPGVLEAVEATFNAVPERVYRFIDIDLHEAVSFRGNDGRSAAILNVFANGIRIITAIREQHLGLRRILVHQRLIAFDVVRFARSERGSDREAFRIRAEMDFGREATTRTAKSIFLNPPFPPAAW